MSHIKNFAAAAGITFLSLSHLSCGAFRGTGGTVETTHVQTPPPAKPHPLTQEDLQKARALAGDDEALIKFINKNPDSAMGLIEQMLPEDQATALAAAGVVFYLAKAGLGGRVMAVIEKMPPKDQVKMLAGDEAIAALTEAGFGEPVMALIEKMSPKDQAKVLAAYGAAYTLTKAGFGERIKAVEANIASASVAAGPSVEGP